MSELEMRGYTVLLERVKSKVNRRGRSRACRQPRTGRALLAARPADPRPPGRRDLRHQGDRSARRRPARRVPRDARPRPAEPALHAIASLRRGRTSRLCNDSLHNFRGATTWSCSRLSKPQPNGSGTRRRLFAEGMVAQRARREDHVEVAPSPWSRTLELLHRATAVRSRGSSSNSSRTRTTSTSSTSSTEATERTLENALIEQGRAVPPRTRPGLRVVGRRDALRVGDDDFFVDLLFFRIPTKRYVVVELKRSAFTPEVAGKLNFYVNVVNDRAAAVPDRKRCRRALCTVGCRHADGGSRLHTSRTCLVTLNQRSLWSGFHRHRRSCRRSRRKR